MIYLPALALLISVGTLIVTVTNSLSRREISQLLRLQEGMTGIGHRIEELNITINRIEERFAGYQQLVKSEIDSIRNAK